MNVENNAGGDGAGAPDAGNTAADPNTGLELHADANAAGDDGGETGADDPGGDDMPSDPRSIKARFAKFTQMTNEALAAARESDLAAARYQGRIEELERRVSGGQRQEAVDPNPAPDAKDYAGGEHDPAYIKDMAKHELRQELAAERATETAAQAAERERTAKRDRFAAVHQAAEANADTPKAAPFLLELLQHKARGVTLADFIAESEHPALIAQHLANNAKAVGELLALVGKDGKVSDANGRDITRRLTKLDASLPGAFQARKTSQAKDPPGNLSGAGGKANSGYHAGMSTEDYRAARMSGALT